jgi:hypothetical protein
LVNIEIEVETMTSKEYIKSKLEYLTRYEPSLSFDIDMYEKILQDLERLEVLEKENQELNDVIEKYNHLNIQSFFIRDREREENKQLKKAIEKACKILSWDCPCSQDLIDDLDCENRCQPDIDYAECWKKYFLKEVLGDDEVVINNE